MTNSAADDQLAPGSAAEGITGEILDIVAKETGIERHRLTAEATIVSLDIASLDMVQAIFALESRFDLEIPVLSSEGRDEFGTVGALVQQVRDAIDAKVAVKAAM